MQPQRFHKLVLTGTVVALVSVPAMAVATTPGANGPIAFRRYLDAKQTKGAVFTMNPDGSRVRQITRPPRGSLDDQPDWAPDGSRLVFTRESAGPFRVAVVNADGTGTRPVTPVCDKKPLPNAVPAGCEDASEASFTPDGLHVTYSRATGHVRHFPKYKWDQIEHAAVAVIGVDGTGEREILRLPRYAGDIHAPQMSPDGRFIVFERVNSPLTKPRLGRALFVMRVNGTHPRRITPWRLHAGDGPDWAPDGSRILFRSKVDVADERSQYYTVRPNGAHLTRITSFPDVKRRLFSATYSPDGKQIVFGRADKSGRGDIWVMNADGGSPDPVLRAKAWDSAVDWGVAAPR